MEEGRLYWNNVYKKDSSEIPMECSSFAKFVSQKFKPGSTLLELGCGNGRDALFFVKHACITSVTAVDLSETAIEKIERLKTLSLTCHVQDLGNLPKSFGKFFTYIYSRFSLHSISKDVASSVLKWSFENLESGGTLYIEARSIKDPLYGTGTPVKGERDAWINTHYRRFIRLDELKEELENLGFIIDYCIESNNLSIHKQDNPILIRVFASKK